MLEVVLEDLVSLYSLVVEHLPSKQEVSGSNPDTGFFINLNKLYIIFWCIWIN